MVDMSDLKDGALREINMDESVFGIEFKSHITIDDLEEIFRHDQLGVGNMHSYIRLLYDRVLRGTALSNRFRFVSSAHCSGMTIASEPKSFRQCIRMTTFLRGNKYLKIALQGVKPSTTSHQKFQIYTCIMKG
ncbi:uncharacterized protein LOC131635554 [Vicia villosa]|uniref:uncharacterized protein LOC131635554 n=1 Tax=Vicia villosa TaxID=3911 RepID=UPI00273A97D6|nr:uncharacterized protein LOC131635554 [Vicia villosa]